MSQFGVNTCGEIVLPPFVSFKKIVRRLWCNSPCRKSQIAQRRVQKLLGFRRGGGGCLDSSRSPLKGTRRYLALAMGRELRHSPSLSPTRRGSSAYGAQHEEIALRWAFPIPWSNGLKILVASMGRKLHGGPSLSRSRRHSRYQTLGMGGEFRHMPPLSPTRRE